MIGEKEKSDWDTVRSDWEDSLLVKAGSLKVPLSEFLYRRS